MKTCLLIVVGTVFIVFSHLAGASYADDTTIRITGFTAGVTPFNGKVALDVSNTRVLKSIQFQSIRNQALSPGRCLARIPTATS